MIRDFWRALVSNKRSCWLGSVAFAILELGLACAFFTPRRLARQDPQLLMESKLDDYAWLTQRIFRYHYSHLSGPQVAYLGASGAKFALAELDENHLSADLSREVGVPSRFVVLTASSERIEHALQLTDQFPDDFRGAVVVVTTPHMAGSSEGRRLHDLPLESPSLTEVDGDDELSMDRRTGIYFLDHLSFFAARRRVALSLPGHFQRLTEMPLLQGAALKKRLASLVTRARTRPTIQLLNEDTKYLERLIQNMNRRGVLTVFVETPTHPDADKIMEKYEPDYREKLAAFVTSFGAVYVDFNSELGLVAKDFSDYTHLRNPAARRLYQRTLMEHVGALLADRILPDQ